MNNIYIAGETTFDILFENDQPRKLNVGGSQLNTSISLGRLGLPVSLITRLGTDRLSRLGENFLRKNGINTSYISRFEGNSRIALAFLDKQKDAEYTFYDDPVADTVLIFPKAKENDIVLFGSSFALKKDPGEYLSRFIRTALTAKSVIIYDPNFRKYDPEKLPELRSIMEEHMTKATIIKGSDEDFDAIYGETDPEKVYAHLTAINKHAVLIFTAGPDSVVVMRNHIAERFPVPSLKPVSTIGAGDGFTAGLIYGLSREGITFETLTNPSVSLSLEDIINDAIAFANNVCQQKENYISKEFADSVNLRRKQEIE